jgi:serine/threonine protein kinase
MQDDYDGWEIVEELASGGQGRVYVALSPDHVEARRKSIRKILDAARAYSGGTDEAHQKGFAGALSEFIDSENTPQLGALKELYIKPGRDEKETVARFENEVKILSENKDPALLKLLYANIERRFMVTEYHPEALPHSGKIKHSERIGWSENRSWDRGRTQAPCGDMRDAIDGAPERRRKTHTLVRSPAAVIHDGFYADRVK